MDVHKSWIVNTDLQKHLPGDGSNCESGDCDLDCDLHITSASDQNAFAGAALLRRHRTWIRDEKARSETNTAGEDPSEFRKEARQPPAVDATRTRTRGSCLASTSSRVHMCQC